MKTVWMAKYGKETTYLKKTYLNAQDVYLLGWNYFEIETILDTENLFRTSDSETETEVLEAREKA